MKLFTKILFVLLFSILGKLQAQVVTQAWASLASGAQPQAIAIDASGNVYTVNRNQNTVSKITSSGTVTQAWATLASNASPYGIAIDASGNVYTANYNNNTVSKITSSGGTVTVTQAWANLALGSVPEGMSIDASGNLYTANYGNNTVSKITSSGTVTPALASLPYNTRLYAVAIDASGNVYTANFGSNSVSKITSSGGTVTVTQTWASLASDAGPVSIAIDASGNVYTANAYNNTISKITSSGGTVTVTQAWASLASGASPYSICIDASGNIYTANSGNSTVSKITSNGTVTQTWASLAPGASPVGIAIDAAGNVYTANNSNGTVSKITPPNTWTGTISTNWGTASNWSYGTVPAITDNVVIPSGTTYSPSYTTFSTTISSLTINAGATLSNSGGSMTVTNALNNSGTIQFGTINVGGTVSNNGSISGNATLNLNGFSAQTITGTGSIANLTIYNGAGVSISSGTTTITGKITPTAGRLTTGGNLVLASTATGTASIAAGTGSYITGNVTLQRYIPGRRAYRFLAHPFTSAIPLSQLTTTIDITGAGGATNGFTTTPTNSPSSFTYSTVSGNTIVPSDPGWTAFANTTSSSWNQYQGARIMVRGAKGEGLSGAAYTPSATTISVSGAVNTGNQVVTLSTSANSVYNFIGNPYPSAIDLSLSTRGSNVGSSFYVWDPALATAGAYTTLPFSASYILPSSAGFFVTSSSSSTGNTITFHESDKVSSNGTALFDLPAHKYLNLSLTSDSISWDRILIEYDANSKAVMDYKDAGKLHNPDVNLYTLSSDGQKLAIDARRFDIMEKLPIGIETKSPYHFKISVNDMPSLASNVDLYLHDKWTDVYTPLTIGATYEFNTTADSNSVGNRFELSAKSNLVSVAADASAAKLSVTAVSGKGNIIVNYAAAKAAITSIRLIGIHGEVIQAKDLGIQQSGQLTLNTGNLANGLYVVEVKVGADSVVKKVITQ